MVLSAWMTSPVCRPVSGVIRVGGAAEHDHSGRNAQGTDLRGEFRGKIGGENTDARDEIFFRIGGVEELIHGS